MSDEPSALKELEHDYNPIFETLVGKLGPQDAEAGLQGLIAYGLYKISKREWVSGFERAKVADPPMQSSTPTPELGHRRKS